MTAVIDENGEERLNRTKTIRVVWENSLSGMGPVGYREAGVRKKV